MTNYKLKELLSIRNGRDYKSQDRGTIPVYGTGGIMLHINNYLHDGESILLPRKGTLDNILYVKGKFWTVDTMYWTLINKDLVYPKYLYYYLSLLDLSSRDSGSALPSMTFDSYYSLDISLPSLEKQKQLADIATLIDDKIENNNKINAKLNELANTIYNYWFLQFDFPNTESRPYKSSGGKMIHNDIVKREIPENWKTAKIKDIISHINTGLNPRQNFILNNGNIKYITVKNLTTNGTIDFTTCDTINKDALEKVHKRSDISKGDILFASIAPLGRCVIIREDPDGWDINESVFSIRPKSKSIAEYLYMFFMSDAFIKKAEHSSTGSVFSGIRISVLEDMKVVVPPENILEKFSRIISPIFDLKYQNEAENQKLKELRDFLLPLLLNNQVTIANEP
ncbi:restriction endonuclease subunit S [Candidatus Saccharibacteria bacterium]|nr:restriction endonuclease subunit S [Candidatus Saccharibacteria bacterium]